MSHYVRLTNMQIAANSFCSEKVVTFKFELDVILYLVSYTNYSIGKFLHFDCGYTLFGVQMSNFCSNFCVISLCLYDQNHRFYPPMKSRVITCPQTEVILKRTVWPWKLLVYSCTEHAPLSPLRLVQFPKGEQMRRYSN